MCLWGHYRSLIGLLFFVFLVLAACSTASANTNRATTPTPPHHPLGTPTPCPTGMGNCMGDMAPPMLVENGQYSDERFIDMMAAHHQMAIEMAQLVKQHGEHPELQTLAANIITTQQQEIKELKNLKKQLYGTDHTPMMMNPSQMDNMGVMMPEQLAQQHPFDQAFLDSMIAHHSSAIEMASVALLRSQNPDILRIAREIKSTQGQEIGQMTEWRQTWYPAHQAVFGESRRG